MGGFVPDEFHEPLGRAAFNLEHHRSLQCAKPIVDEKKRQEDRRYADGHKPFIADVTGRPKD